MSPKNETQVGRFDGKCLYPLSQLAGPHFSEKSIFSSKHKMHLSSQSTGLWVGRTQVRMLQEKDWMHPHLTLWAGRRMQDTGGYATRERLDAASYWAVRRMQEDMPQERLHIVPLSFLPFLQL